MKILYAVQGTGNGHLSRAMQIYPHLIKYGRVDVLVSGTENALKPNFPVKYQYSGLGFVFGRNGGIDLIKTYNDARIWRFLKSVEEVPVKDYDLVINDFEPITAWACRLREVPVVSLSHQSSLLKPGVPKPQTVDLPAELVLKHYAPAPASVGFHFRSYHEDIFTPVIRKELYRTVRKAMNHITVYLPAFAVEKLTDILPSFKGVAWQVFSRTEKQFRPRADMVVFPVDANMFVNSMLSSAGIISGAGFETPSEALFLGIPLLAVPMKGQYEQACNAAALEQLGVSVVWKTGELTKERITAWFETREEIRMNYPEVIEPALERVMTLQKDQSLQERGVIRNLKSLLAG